MLAADRRGRNLRFQGRIPPYEQYGILIRCFGDFVVSMKDQDILYPFPAGDPDAPPGRLGRSGISGTGTMAESVRVYDWRRTPLGPVSGWSQPLLCAVNTILGSQFPMAVYWGRQMIQLYNDAYLALIAEKHPRALGAPAVETWKEAWHILGSQFEAALVRGEATLQENVPIPILRAGRVEELYWSCSTSPIRSPNGEILGILMVCHDETKQRRYELALKESEKLAAAGRLAASIAHEINNPLEVVTNLLYLALQTADLGELHGYLHVAEREMRRISVISNQTLRFYRQSSDPRPAYCEELIESVLFLQSGRLGNAHIQVEQRLRARQPVCCFDGEIRQVLNNLLANAIDSMHHNGGRLLVRSREATHWSTRRKGLVLTVADTGGGIEPENLRRIFEPFFTTKGARGTGLGLWVSEEIVNRHHGSLRVRSSQRSLKSGTVFTIFLPFDCAQQQSVQSAA